MKLHLSGHDSGLVLVIIAQRIHDLELYQILKITTIVGLTFCAPGPQNEDLLAGANLSHA